MKKVILSVAAILAFGVVSAQETDKSSGGKGFQNGDVFMTGTVGISSEKTGDFKTTEFTVAPSAGLFVTDHIAVGLQLGFSSSKEEEPGEEDFKTTAFGIGAFGRYYFTPANDFSVFGQLGASYATIKQEQGPNEAKANGFGVAFNPGISYFVSEHFVLEAGFGEVSYSSVKPDADGAESTNNFEFGLDLTSITFGLTYKF